jgi:uncharacterized protein (TIGR02246 family)
MTHNARALQNLARDYTAAWNSGDPAAVAGFFAPDGQISINRGDALIGTAALTAMAAGFHAEFPDLALECDLMRDAGDHCVYVWTLSGHHAQTRNPVRVGGWEEWELGDDLKINRSAGWFDAVDYQRQIDGT